MKARFLVILLTLVLLVSVVALVVSKRTTESSLRRLVLESAEHRLSLIAWGFNATTQDVDLYSYLEFEHETMTVKKAGMPVFQYGTAFFNVSKPGVARFERTMGGYNFVLLVDLEAELADRFYPVTMTIYTICGIFALLFAVTGLVFVNMLANPIARMAETVERITSRNLNVRLPVPSRKDELRKLVVTFNAMLDDIASTYVRQVRLIEDLTHDIATPVQIMEGFRQLAERHGNNPGLMAEFMEAAKVQLRRLRSMTETLRDSLAAERVRRVERADATAITTRNLSYYRELHPDIEFMGSIAKGVHFAVAPEDFERIEGILVDNAVKYGRSGGKVEITLKRDRLCVRDFGVGIPPEERQAIFERYHRSPGAETMGPGSGIGLSILRRFSEEYGFRIEVDSELGSGSTFRLLFRDPSAAR